MMETMVLMFPKHVVNTTKKMESMMGSPVRMQDNKKNIHVGFVPFVEALSAIFAFLTLTFPVHSSNKPTKRDIEKVSI